MTSTTPTLPAERREVRADDRLAGAVVVGVDGSDAALSAVRWAAREAEARGTSLRILHAAPYLGRGRSADGPPAEQFRAQQIVAVAYTVARHTGRRVPVGTAIVRDEPVRALLRAGADGQLLALGVSTTGAADELVLASVTRRVAARSAHPVVAVPRARPGRDDRGRVVAVLGLGGPVDDAAVEFAAAAARRSGRGLLVLDARPADLAQPDGRFPDLEAEHRRLPGASAVELLDAASPAPLIVLAAGHPGRFPHPLGRRARWLLRHCTVPLALVPSVPAGRGRGAAPPA